MSELMTAAASMSAPERSSAALTSRESSGEAAALHLWASLSKNADTDPEGVGLRTKLRGLWRAESWRDWHNAAAGIAARLRDAGVRRGDRVMLVLEDEAAWLHASMAVVALDATQVLVAASTPAEHVARRADELGCRVLVSRRRDLLEVAASQEGAQRRLRVIPPEGVELGQVLLDEAARDQRVPLALLLPPDGSVVHVTVQQAVRTADEMLEQVASPRGRHVLVGMDAASLSGLAARLVLTVRDRMTLCVPEAGVGFFDSLRDVEPSVALATSEHWESIWREIRLARLEASPMHRWLFDQAMDHPPHKSWSPLALVRANLRRHLGLRGCELVVSNGAPLSQGIAQWLRSLGPRFLQVEVGRDSCLEDELRALTAVKHARVKAESDPVQHRVELTLDVDAALRWSSLKGLDADDGAALATNAVMRGLVEDEVRELFKRRGEPRLSGLTLEFGGAAHRSS